MRRRLTGQPAPVLPAVDSAVTLPLPPLVVGVPPVPPVALVGAGMVLPLAPIVAPPPQAEEPPPPAPVPTTFQIAVTWDPGIVLDPPEFVLVEHPDHILHIWVLAHFPDGDYYNLVAYSHFDIPIYENIIWIETTPGQDLLTVVTPDIPGDLDELVIFAAIRLPDPFTEPTEFLEDIGGTATAAWVGMPAEFSLDLATGGATARVARVATAARADGWQLVQATEFYTSYEEAFSGYF